MAVVVEKTRFERFRVEEGVWPENRENLWEGLGRQDFYLFCFSSL